MGGAGRDRPAGDNGRRARGRLAHSQRARGAGATGRPVAQPPDAGDAGRGGRRRGPDAAARRPGARSEDRRRRRRRAMARRARSLDVRRRHRVHRHARLRGPGRIAGAPRVRGRGATAARRAGATEATAGRPAHLRVRHDATAGGGGPQRCCAPGPRAQPRDQRCSDGEGRQRRDRSPGVWPGQRPRQRRRPPGDAVADACADGARGIHARRASGVLVDERTRGRGSRGVAGCGGRRPCGRSR